MTSSEFKAFFSVLLLAAGLWAACVLVPMARRSHDVFGMVCAMAGAVIALAAWLMIGTSVRSQGRPRDGAEQAAWVDRVYMISAPPDGLRASRRLTSSASDSRSTGLQTNSSQPTRRARS